MDSEWKELEIGNLPPDILVGDYEFQWNNGVKWVSYERVQPVLSIIADVETDKTRYRKRQPKTPTHRDRMTLWWKDCEYSHGRWDRVTSYDPNAKDMRRYYIFGM